MPAAFLAPHTRVVSLDTIDLRSSNYMLSRRHLVGFPVVLAVFAMSIAAAAQQPVGELYATDASVKGSVILASSGTSVLSGSSIQAGAQAATLKLERGGSLLVCEGTKLSITASQSGRQLLFSLNSGNLEMNYPLGAEADTLLTPDLRLLLPGPGTVHFAVRITPQGDTCVQSLPWNVAAITISETMGDATYQVKPDEAVLFKGGHLSAASPFRGNCGCPKSQPVPMQVAKAALPPTPPAQPTPAQPLSAPPPTSTESHMTVEAPFVFNGADPTPDLSGSIAVLKLESDRVVQLDPTVVPPASANKKKSSSNSADNTQTAKKESHGFFSKVGAFFAAIFH